MCGPHGDDIAPLPSSAFGGCGCGPTRGRNNSCVYRVGSSCWLFLSLSLSLSFSTNFFSLFTERQRPLRLQLSTHTNIRGIGGGGGLARMWTGGTSESWVAGKNADQKTLPLYFDNIRGRKGLHVLRAHVGFKRWTIRHCTDDGTVHLADETDVTPNVIRQRP